MDIDIDKPLEPQIRLELVREMLTKLDYDLDAERVNRIADGMREYMDKGVPASYALAGALDVELLMYGDPHEPDADIKPIGVSPLKRVLRDVFTDSEARDMANKLIN